MFSSPRHPSRPTLNRRGFLLAAGGAGSSLLLNANAAVPCPPPIITVGGNSASSAACPTNIPQGTSALAALAASMSSGQWANFSMGGMSAALLDAGNSHSITEYASRGHWDPVHRKIQFWGQGHYSSEKLITWDDATNQWSVGTPAIAGSIGHAYYHLAMDPTTGDLYLRAFGSTAVKKKPYGGAWVNITPFQNVSGQVAGALEWFPSANAGAGGLAFCDVKSVQTWAPTANAWSTRSSTLSGLGNYHNWGVAAGSSVYCGGGNGSTAMYRLDANGSVSAAPSTPITAGVGSGIVLRHPDGNHLLLFAQGATGAIHRFNGSSWATHGTHQIGGTTNLWFGVPVSTYGVIVFVAQTNGASSPTVTVYKP
jgi:hypothetical protein